MASRRPALYVEPALPRWWDATVIVLTTVSLVFLVVDLGFEDDTSDLMQGLRWADAAICGVFLVDFGLRLARAKQRWQFFKRNWIDLLGAIPLAGPLHALRIVRVVRILRFTRIAVLSRRLLRYFDVAVPTQALGYLTLVTLAIWLIAGMSFYAFEHGINENVDAIDDALWWSMTTLSTVGYGDLYPVTAGGRVVAFGTMILGVGVLGSLAATIATALLDARERGRKGLRSYRMERHLLILGWNEKAYTAIEEFRADPRYASTRIVIVADVPEHPYPDDTVRFVRGQPGRAEVLDRAAARDAAVAIAFARDPKDPRSDHETAMVVLALRELNPDARVSAELVHPDHREYLRRAGCDSVVDNQAIASTLLVRTTQDVGVAEVLEELVRNGSGAELYRVRVPSDYVGLSVRDFCVAMLDRGCMVIGIERGGQRLLNPDRDLRVQPDDDAFVVAHEPPSR
jgi:voltage-gated potassium channel